MMTREQEEHLESVKKEFSTWCDYKYRKGQAEHGGDLIKVDPSQVLDMAIDEAVDLVVYLLTLKQQMKTGALGSQSMLNI